MKKNLKAKEETGFAGLAQYGGWISREPKSDLRGLDGVKIYRDMVYDNPTISAMVNAIKTICLQTELNVEDNGNEINTEFLRENIDKLHRPFNEVLSDSLSMIIYGWSVLEIIYAKKNGKTILEDIALRDQSTLSSWVLDDKDRPTHLNQVHPSSFKTVNLPLNKCLHFTIGDNISPEGLSLLRSSYKSYYYITHLERQESIAIERQATSMPKISVPSAIMNSSANSAEKATLSSLVSMAQSIRTDEQSVMIIPSDRDENGNLLYEIEPWVVPQSGIDIGKVVNRHKTDMLQSLLADWITLGSSSGGGSYALADSKTEVFAMLVTSILKNIESTLNHQLVKPLFKLNGITTDLPKFKFAEIETQDLNNLGNYVDKLVASGILQPSTQIADYLLAQANIPNNQDDL